MCFFKNINFQLYPEATALHEIYHGENETEQQYKERRKAQRAERAAGNKRKNLNVRCGLKKVAEGK